MPGNAYNLKINLSNGSTINAGEFIAPQGASILRVSTSYPTFQATVPRNQVYPNGVSLYGGELMIWGSGQCSVVTASDISTITSTLIPEMNLTGPQGPQGPQGVKGDTGNTGPQGPQGEAGGDVFCKLSAVSSSGSDLDALGNVASNPNVFCAMIVSPDKNTRFRLVTGSLTTQSNFLYLYIMRSVSDDRWSYYWGVTYDGSNYDFVTGDLGANTTAKIASISGIMSLYGAYYKY